MASTQSPITSIHQRSLLVGKTLIVCMAFATPALASAQTDQPEIVITATRHPINIKDAPASVSVISAADIEQMTLFTVDEALKNTVGVMNRRTKGFMETTPSLTIRGFSNARDNLLLVDGIPQNDSRNGQINWTMIDADNIERIEVVRGPFSSLYGSNAMGGVVSIITRVAEESGASIKVGYGGSVDSIAPENSRDLAFSGNLRASGTLAMGMSVRQRSTDGYATTHVNVSSAQLAALPAGTTGATPYLSNIGAQTHLVGDSGDNWYNDDSVSVRLNYTPTPATRLDLSWSNSDGDYGYEQPNSYLRSADGTPTYANIALTSWLNGAVFARGGSVEQSNTGLNFSTQLGTVST